jgi:hypothetical protein
MQISSEFNANFFDISSDIEPNIYELFSSEPFYELY